MFFVIVFVITSAVYENHGSQRGRRVIILPEGTVPTANLSEGRSEMSCKSCQADQQSTFPAEINIHFPGQKNLTKPSVWAFPKLLVCLNCGFTEFVLEQPDVARLSEGSSAEEARSQSFGT